MREIRVFCDDRSLQMFNLQKFLSMRYGTVVLQFGFNFILACTSHKAQTELQTAHNIRMIRFRGFRLTQHCFNRSLIFYSK
jgi:hypothetical protein